MSVMWKKRPPFGCTGVAGELREPPQGPSGTMRSVPLFTPTLGRRAGKKKVRPLIPRSGRLGADLRGKNSYGSARLYRRQYDAVKAGAGLRTLHM